MRVSASSPIKIYFPCPRITSTSSFFKFWLLFSVSAVTENEFYEIPRSYLTKGGNSSNQGFICEKYDNGNLITTFVEADIYKLTDDYVYVSKSDWESGIAVVMPDSASRYVIGATKKLKGVYCVNTQYSVRLRLLMRIMNIILSSKILHTEYQCMTELY